MPLFTRYGSQVNIVASYKKQADIGVFLVQAQVVTQGKHVPHTEEQPGQLVAQNDPYQRGWIPSTQLIAEGGPEELLQTCMTAPDGTPNNASSLLKLFWSGIFGMLNFDDVLAKATIMSTIRRFGN